MDADMKRREKNKKSGEEGFAIFEAIAFLFAFVMLTVYVIDFFTAIHTGIVNSIAARTYLFETLEHRSDISLFRPENPLDYSDRHVRFHAINDEDDDPNATTFVPVPGRILTQSNRDETIQGQVLDPRLDSGRNKATIIYVKTGYGICIDSACPGG
jgi:hypothetical protein